MIILEIIFLQHFQPYHKVSNIFLTFHLNHSLFWKFTAKDDFDIFFLLLFLSLHKLLMEVLRL